MLSSAPLPPGSALRHNPGWPPASSIQSVRDSRGVAQIRCKLSSLELQWLQSVFPIFCFLSDKYSLEPEVYVSPYLRPSLLVSFVQLGELAQHKCIWIFRDVRDAGMPAWAYFGGFVCEMRHAAALYWWHLQPIKRGVCKITSIVA